MMVDNKKRRSMKVLAGAAVLPMLPTSFANAALPTPMTSSQITAERAFVNKDLSIEILLGDEPMMRVTNNSDSLTILRTIHRGVVHAGDTAFDLNHSLNSSACAIGAGRSRLLPIVAVSSDMARPPHPMNDSHDSLLVASVVADGPTGRILYSSRAFSA